MLLSAAIAPSVANAAPAYEGQNLIVNGDFETGAMDPWTFSASNIGIATPNDNIWISSNQSAKNTVGKYGCYIQTHPTLNNLVDGYIQQKFQIEAGTYEYGFDCSVRPNNGGNYGGVPFYVYLVYYPNGADDESGAVETLLKEVPTPNNGNNNLGYPFVHVGDIIEVETTGCYAFRILQKKLSDYPALAQNHSYGNSYDNISFKCLAPYEYPAGNLVKNGTFDAGNDVQSGTINDGATIPCWTITNRGQTGHTAAGLPPSGSWVNAAIVDDNGVAANVGRYALFYQRNKTEPHYVSQDIVVPETGLYYISLKYTDRKNVNSGDYPGFPFSFETVSGGTTNTLLEVADGWDHNTILHSLSAYKTLQAGACTVQLKFPKFDWNTGTGVAIDDIIIMKAGVATAEWTGGGAANDLSDPDNWLCKDGEGGVISGVLPDPITQTLYFKGTFAVDIPAGSALQGQSVVFSDNAKLSRDCDWRGVSQTLSGTLDLFGNSLAISAMNGTAEFTDTSADASAPGELHLDFASGTLTNSGIALSGNLKFVKEGGGTFVSARQQSYSGGTLVAGGVAQPPDGSGANANYSGNRFKAFSNGPITVGEGAVFDIRANYDYNNSDGRNLAINLDGGTFRNSGASMTETSWGYSGAGSVTKDSFIRINGTRDTLFTGNAIGDLNGHRLNAVVAGGKVLNIKGCNMSNGTFAVSGASANSIGWFGPQSNLDMRTVTFDVSCIISLGTNTVDVKDYIVNYVGNSEKESAGLGPLNVHGSFKPNTDYFYGCTMLDGSTIDLSSRTTALPAATAFTRAAASLRREISYAGGTVAVIPPASVGGKTMRELSKSRDASGAYNGYIMYWNAQPAGVSFKLGGDDVSGCVLRATSAGLLLRPSPGMAVVVR